MTCSCILGTSHIRQVSHFTSSNITGSLWSPGTILSSICQLYAIVKVIVFGLGEVRLTQECWMLAMSVPTVEASMFDLFFIISMYNFSGLLAELYEYHFVFRYIKVLNSVTLLDQTYSKRSNRPSSTILHIT